jgi:hypothetical protein
MNRTEMKKLLQSALNDTLEVLKHLIIESSTYPKLNESAFNIRGVLHLLENTDEDKGIMIMGIADEYEGVLRKQGKEVVTTKIP